MEPQKPGAWIGLLLLAVFAWCSPVNCRAEMYVEAYLGGVTAANQDFPLTTASRNTFGFPGLNGSFRQSPAGRTDPAVMGGLKVGTWFVNDGILGFNYPGWMKYLGFYLDFSYHRLNFRGQEGTVRVSYLDTSVAPPAGPAVADAGNLFASEGTAATLAFMFAARYGFFPDSQAPLGRLQPYVAVGPAILFASQTPKLLVRAHQADGPNLTVAVNNDRSYEMGRNSAAALCLAMDAGLRYLILQQVSLDLFFRYRLAEPSFSYNFTDPFDGSRKSFTLNPTYHLFSGHLGVAYHF